MGDFIFGTQVIIYQKVVCHHQNEHKRYLIFTFIHQVIEFLISVIFWNLSQMSFNQEPLRLGKSIA